MVTKDYVLVMKDSFIMLDINGSLTQEKLFLTGREKTGSQ